MLVQVPLRYRQPMRRTKAATSKSKAAFDDVLEGAAPASGYGSAAAGRADVEAAVLGHGPELGPYTELDGLTIERDPRFPVRVTVQFYQATSNGVLSAAIVRDIAAQIGKVYRSADYVGSLVVPSPRENPRVTAWQGTTLPPAGVTWWDFPGLVQRVWDGAAGPICK
jgi:hypothetical protein